MSAKMTADNKKNAGVPTIVAASSESKLDRLSTFKRSSSFHMGTAPREPVTSPEPTPGPYGGSDSLNSRYLKAPAAVVGSEPRNIKLAPEPSGPGVGKYAPKKPLRRAASFHMGEAPREPKVSPASTPGPNAYLADKPMRRAPSMTFPKAPRDTEKTENTPGPYASSDSLDSRRQRAPMAVLGREKREIVLSPPPDGPGVGKYFADPPPLSRSASFHLGTAKRETGPAPSDTPAANAYDTSKFYKSGSMSGSFDRASRSTDNINATPGPYYPSLDSVARYPNAPRVMMPRAPRSRAESLDSLTPGPGNYNVEEASKRLAGATKAPAALLGTSKRSGDERKDAESLPGPNAYLPDVTKHARVRNPPAFTIAPRAKERPRSGRPGPNQYDTAKGTDQIRRKTSGVKIGTSPRWSPRKDAEDGPSPLSYYHQRSRSSPAITISPRWKEPTAADTPGPGAYTPAAPRTTRKGITMGQRTKLPPLLLSGTAEDQPRGSME